VPLDRVDSGGAVGFDLGPGTIAADDGPVDATAQRTGNRTQRHVAGDSPNETPLPFVGPACREQPRPTDEMKFSPSAARRLSSLSPTGYLRWAEVAQQPESTRAQDAPGAADDMPGELIPSPPAESPSGIIGENGNELPCFEPQPLSELQADIALPEGRVPTNRAAACASDTPPVSDLRLSEGWALTNYQWSATHMHHRPLYFEEVNAERYGYTPSYFFQPVISGARFFLTIPALPYKMAIDHPHERVYTLGHYRPGTDGVPRRRHCLPLRITAATVEVGVIAGLILLVP